MAETPNYPKVETTCHGCVHLQDEGDGVGGATFTSSTGAFPSSANAKASQLWKKKHNYAAPHRFPGTVGFFMWLFRQILRRNEMTGIP